ncbi:prevent-host-death family protein [Treponema primitia]|uniref:prevent-host-death family protein n=1 Tax=Treponema primitia TaxID=88058 RepID=UPI0002555842|nr:prevent-host-death family protein [Treponema primitia]
MGALKFLSMRELRTSTGKIKEMLTEDKKLVVTNNGKPAAIMLEVSELTLEDMLSDIRQMQAKRALRELQNAAVKNGTASMTMDEINAEIAAVHKERILTRGRKANPRRKKY